MTSIPSYFFNACANITSITTHDAITNIERKGIVNADTAYHRCNKAKVIKIETMDGIQYDEAVSYHGSSMVKPLLYKVNEMVEVDNYDMDLDKVCSTGIHFFLTKRVAELYGLHSITNGFFQSWYDNGQKYCECTHVDNEFYGLFTIWYENDNKKEECTYKKGVRNGLFTTW